MFNYPAPESGNKGLGLWGRDIKVPETWDVNKAIDQYPYTKSPRRTNLDSYPRNGQGRLTRSSNIVLSRLFLVAAA